MFLMENLNIFLVSVIDFSSLKTSLGESSLLKVDSNACNKVNLNKKVHAFIRELSRTSGKRLCSLKFPYSHLQAQSELMRMMKGV